MILPPANLATHSFQRLIEIDSLSYPDTGELIQKRLIWAGYDGSLESFIDRLGLESLQNLTQGHPRGIISVLGYAIEVGYNDKIKQLNHEQIIKAFEKAKIAGLFGSKGITRISLNESDIRILQYIKDSWATMGI